MIKLQEETATLLFWQKIEDKAKIGSQFYALRLKTDNKILDVLILEENIHIGSELYSFSFNIDKFSKLKKFGFYDKNLIAKKIEFILKQRMFSDYQTRFHDHQVLKTIKISPKLKYDNKMYEIDEKI